MLSEEVVLRCLDGRENGGVGIYIGDFYGGKDHMEKWVCGLPTFSYSVEAFGDMANWVLKHLRE